MALQIVGAALPRTGTLSLKFALEMLGFGPCYHMSEFILHPEHRWRWMAARWLPQRLDPIWQDFRATVDSPGCRVWRQLTRRHPQAKVILTRRDPDKWVESVKATVGSDAQVTRMLRTPLLPALIPLNPFGMSRDHDAMVRHFEAYGEEVRRTIAPGRLLEFRASDGWEPLCRFLDVPVPATPFPRVNERDAMKSATPDDIPSMSFAEIQQTVRAFLKKERQSLLSR